jgi:RNA polymerase sigma-70 factor (sigma-E family)
VRSANVAYGGEVEDRRGRVERLYASHIQEATRLAYLMTGDRQLAEDLAQDAFVRSASRFQHLRGEDAFAGYLMTAVVNACRGSWRKRKVERAYIDRVRGEGPSTATQPDVATRMAVTEALSLLPTRQRAAVVLRHYADLSEQRTADLMGCSVGTVKTLTSRGLKTLRERMKS